MCKTNPTMISETGTWYEMYIESPIRDLVKLLRDNGFNTQSSCGHEMSVQCGYSVDGELMRLHHLLYNSGYKDYEITVHICIHDGHLYQFLNIVLSKTKEDINTKEV